MQSAIGLLFAIQSQVKTPCDGSAAIPAWAKKLFIDKIVRHLQTENDCSQKLLTNTNRIK